jgi:enamine deaminase RidA (YjgF/YER057c/UK114 family)
MTHRIVNPEALGVPKGWSHGILAASGRILFVAGQSGWEEGAAGTPPNFADQFARVLDKVLAVVAEAGGAPADIARLTIYVTDLGQYRECRKRLGAAWRDRFGSYYPAVALVEVSGLVDDGALVEMEATAVLGGNG